MCSCRGGCGCSSNSTALPIGPKGDQGLTGPTGATGATGATGPAGQNSPFYELFVTPETYGAIGDGITDDTEAIQNMVNSGISIFIPEKTYKITSSVSVPLGCSIIGSGINSIINTTNNITMFNIIGNNVSISNLTFIGSNSGALQTGIAVTGNAGFTLLRQSIKLTNITFQDCFYAGFFTQYIIGSSGGYEHMGGTYLTQCVANNCGYGYFCSTRGEYNILNGCVAYLCNVGFQNNAGNNSWNGGAITDCSTGFALGAGTNGGHSACNGAKIHHNTTYNVYGDNIISGYDFIGCTIQVTGSISLNNCDLIRFLDCTIYTADVTLNNCTNTSFINNKFRINPTFTITGTDALYFNNYFASGAPTALKNTLYGGALVLPVAGDGISIKEGANATMGVGTLVAGVKTISTTKITANSRIILTTQSLGTVVSPKAIAITARLAGTSFTITSADPTDTSVIAWQIIEPA